MKHLPPTVLSLLGCLCAQTPSIDEHTLEVEVSKEQNLNDIFARLTSQGVDVLSMRNKVNRLEEMFMRLVENRTP
jgi:N-methylhydantoinase A/oxoprolinase/acetone carboxylase beta subunit